MARIVTIHEAKTNLSKLIKAALAGEEIVIARGNVPLVRLEMVESARAERRLGFAGSTITMSDDFDEPLDDFEGYQ